MKIKRIRSCTRLAGCLSILLLLFLPTLVLAGGVAILEVDINSYQVNLAVSTLGLPEDIEAKFFTWQELQGSEDAKKFIEKCDLVFVNVMMSELATYMVDEGLMAGRKVYALNRAKIRKNCRRKGI